VSTRRAPELPQLDAAHWLNSPPLKLAALRGRPVLIEFWAFGCSNCRNTLPWLERTHARYASKWPAFYHQYSGSHRRHANRRAACGRAKGGHLRGRERGRAASTRRRGGHWLII